jgi:hypothetical protein
LCITIGQQSSRFDFPGQPRCFPALLFRPRMPALPAGVSLHPSGESSNGISSRTYSCRRRDLEPDQSRARTLHRNLGLLRRGISLPQTARRFMVTSTREPELPG